MTEEEYVQKLKDESHVAILCFLVGITLVNGKNTACRSRLIVKEFNAVPSPIGVYCSPKLISAKLRQLKKLGYVKKFLPIEQSLSDFYPVGYWSITLEGCDFLLQKSPEDLDVKTVKSFLELK